MEELESENGLHVILERILDFHSDITTQLINQL